MSAIERLIAEAPRFFTWWNALFLAQAAANTLLLALAGCLAGFVLGFVLATVRVERVSRARAPRLVAIAYVELVRRVPTLVLLMLVFYAYQLSGTATTAFWVAMTAMVLRSAALFSENIRSGYESIHPAQWDAAETMNMSPWQALRLTILPQAWKVILPPVNANALGMVKATSLASQLSVLELTFAARQLNLRGFSALICYGTVLILYFLMSWGVGRLGAYAERRLVSHRR